SRSSTTLEGGGKKTGARHVMGRLALLLSISSTTLGTADKKTGARLPHGAARPILFEKFNDVGGDG
ncbi:MAG: hypothetical protein IJ668_03670, partial [Selenomonadaceae bacterium]|nr:hypothetical protein [Selenomonadaceae bacterium]